MAAAEAAEIPERTRSRCARSGGSGGGRGKNARPAHSRQVSVEFAAAHAYWSFCVASRALMQGITMRGKHIVL
jgi:hypothetical protein